MTPSLPIPERIGLIERLLGPKVERLQEAEQQQVQAARTAREVAVYKGNTKARWSGNCLAATRNVLTAERCLADLDQTQNAVRRWADAIDQEAPEWASRAEWTQAVRDDAAELAKLVATARAAMRGLAKWSARRPAVVRKINGLGR